MLAIYRNFKSTGAPCKYYYIYMELLLYKAIPFHCSSTALPLTFHTSSELDMVDHAYNPSAQETETEKPQDYEIKARLGLNSHLKASLDYIEKVIKRKEDKNIFSLTGKKLRRMLLFLNI